jgi:hypothetical protein
VYGAISNGHYPSVSSVNKHMEFRLQSYTTSKQASAKCTYSEMDPVSCAQTQKFPSVIKFLIQGDLSPCPLDSVVVGTREDD